MALGRLGCKSISWCRLADHDPRDHCLHSGWSMNLGDAYRKLLHSWAGPLAGPLGRRLLIGLILLSVVPLALSNGLGYLRSTTIIQGLVERYLDGIADLQALHVRDQVLRHTLLLREMVSTAAIESVLNESASSTEVSAASLEDDPNPFLVQQLEEHPGFEALYVFTADGDILASAPLPPADLGLWMGPPLSEPRGTVEVVWDSAPPRVPWMRLAVALRSSDQGQRGVFLGGYVEVLGPSQFMQLPEHTAGTVESFVVSDDGIPIFVSHPHGLIDYGAPLATPLLAKGLGSSVVYSDRQGVEVIGTVVAVPGHSWRLITEVPVSDALQELRQLRGVSLWLGSLLALVVIIVAWAMSGRIVAPVRRLVAATRRLAGGDLEARVDVLKRNEIGELGAAFNDMASELAQTSARVEELHRREIVRAGQLATVGELAAGVAHEIKNPIAGIAGGMDLVMRDTKDEMKLRPIVDEMQRQVSRVQMAVRDLLAFARPPSLDFAPTDVNNIVERAVTLVWPTADSANVTISIDKSELPTVLADEEMIRQSLVNLIVNAVQATSPGGEVAVITSSASGGVEVRIEDTGEGMSPEELQQIFKPFFTTKHQGTGLGLSITRSIIERHEGTVSVESEVGKGTKFRLTLPLEAEGAEHSGASSPADRNKDPR